MGGPEGDSYGRKKPDWRGWIAGFFLNTLALGIVVNRASNRGDPALLLVAGIGATFGVAWWISVKFPGSRFAVAVRIILWIAAAACSVLSAMRAPPFSGWLAAAVGALLISTVLAATNLRTAFLLLLGAAQFTFFCLVVAGGVWMIAHGFMQGVALVVLGGTPLLWGIAEGILERSRRTTDADVAGLSEEAWRSVVSGERLPEPPGRHRTRSHRRLSRIGKSLLRLYCVVIAGLLAWAAFSEGALVLGVCSIIFAFVFVTIQWARSPAIYAVMLTMLGCAITVGSWFFDTDGIVIINLVGSIFGAAFIALGLGIWIGRYGQNIRSWWSGVVADRRLGNGAVATEEFQRPPLPEFEEPINKVHQR